MEKMNGQNGKDECSEWERWTVKMGKMNAQINVSNRSEEWPFLKGKMPNTLYPYLINTFLSGRYKHLVSNYIQIYNKAIKKKKTDG